MNPRSNFRVLGAMSGTSLDGLDLVLVHFEQNESWSFKIEKGTTIPYTPDWKSRLSNAPHLSGLELKRLDLDFAQFCATEMKGFLQGDEVDFIASHGHTVFHEPHNMLTHQIGDVSTIAAITGVDVLADFRSKDVALGGQGAPLVPVGDELLFHQYDACVNLGGFANVSLQKQGVRVAWDVCPANIVLNACIAEIGELYDDQGKLAASGEVLPTLLEELERLPFYEQPAPKSLGREWVEEHITPILEIRGDLKDVLATFVEHVARRVASDLSQVKGQVLFTGGGVHNDYLMKRISELATFTVERPENQLIEFKEALVFAFLGVLWKVNAPNCLSQVTGAKEDHISGVFAKGIPSKKTD